MKAPAMCPHCGGMSTPSRCREVLVGWWCYARGLYIDPAKLIHPTFDPIGSAEQAVIDEYAPLLKEAEGAVDEALQAWTEAQQAHRQALVTAQGAGVSGHRLSATIMDPHHNFTPRRKPLALGEAERLIDAEQQASKQLAAAERALTGARVRLNDLERRREHAQRQARATVSSGDSL